MHDLDETRPLFINCHSSIPVFKENLDDLDAYQKQFVLVAMGQEWPKEKWAIGQGVRLHSEVVKVFGGLSPEA